MLPPAINKYSFAGSSPSCLLASSGEMRSTPVSAVGIPSGYTDKMPLYLKAGSIFITKPGGLSSTEAAAARIPLIHICPIPGCETKNMQFFKKTGMALAVTNPKEELTAAVLSLQKQENRKKMIQCQEKYVPGTAAAQLGQLVEEGKK